MVIAAFDFDGTLTTRDTLFHFIIFAFGRRKLFRALAVLSPVLILHKIKLVSNHKAKERLFGHLFAGMSVNEYRDLCRNYAAEVDKILDKAVMDKLLIHQQQGDTTVVISASIEDWIKPWANNSGIDEVLATQVEVANGTITGKFKSQNCYGQEKVNRLLNAYPNRKDYQLYAYGDSVGDRELLALADFSFYRYKAPRQ
ncbi:HAD family hydrolase [Mucilaginibacter ginkgonis]|uniref:Haloacid dehalogenase-like hydrolase n=1 Tax=Mucilaginibacter ginkgonis TaxID=2682091 RepID=A0A6I4IML3_9SPHI|nr:HAD family hydrolase [Mucilaginibacter ginkgonis]QQL50105.1 haloacid dehalogenase-like hydrolase [Mucilaginibacter ginkgonis]